MRQNKDEATMVERQSKHAPAKRQRIPNPQSTIGILQLSQKLPPDVLLCESMACRKQLSSLLRAFSKPIAKSLRWGIAFPGLSESLTEL